MIRFNLRTPSDVALDLRDRFRKRRLDMNITQAQLAERSGVNLHTLRRFEKAGMISFEALLKLALVLDVLEDFDEVGAQDARNITSQTLDDVLSSRRSKQRNRARR
ncbi:helix-turn-helix domain-containing protein [Hyphomicrobium sp.]|uniref:helix-turn-helix domain-containing protein n=1 Tax=Hyphomicrobium sp. TaxID=82 RepID=UPI003F729106